MYRKKSLVSLLLTFVMVFAQFVPFTVISFADVTDAPVDVIVDELVTNVPTDVVVDEIVPNVPADVAVSEALLDAALAAEPVFDPALVAPTADVVNPPAQPWRNPAFAGDPSGFRPDQVPDSVSLTKPENSLGIVFTKEVVTIPKTDVVYLNTVRRAAGPTQEQIDAVPAPELDLINAYNGPISLAEIDADKAVIIKAITFANPTGLALTYSNVATFVYYQRVWVLTDVFTDGDGNPNDNTQKNPTAWTNFILDEIVKEMTQSELALMTGGSVNGQLANEMPHPYGAYTTGTINSVANQYGRSDVRLNSRTTGTDLGISRLSIPTTSMIDGPAGVRNHYDNSLTWFSSAWVVATALASSWDREVQHNFASRVAEEAAYLGFDMMLAPAMNIHRSPLGGRNFEYYSEDPYVSYVNGLVYTNAMLEKRIGVSLKHYLANDQENNRNNLSSTVSERTLREVMGYPFMRVVEESDPYALMSIYGIINQGRASDHNWLLDQLPREQWGFQGYVQTDWGNHWDAHSMAARLNQHQSGNNHTMGNQFVDYENGRDDTDGLSTPETREIRLNTLRRNARDILVSKIKMPTFNGKYDDLTTSITDVRQREWYTDPNSPQSESARLNRDLAAKCFILLKNNKVNDVPVLPLTGDNKKSLTLIYSSTVPTNHQGNVDYVVQGGGSGEVRWGLQRTGTIYNALTSAEFGYTIPNYIRENDALLNAANVEATAAQYAANTDVGIMIISRPSAEGSDRALADFSLNANELRVLPALYNAFKAVGKPFVVIINMGGNINTTQIRANSDAILHMSDGGEMGGWAVADVLSGKVNPSGKTVDSWPITFDDAVPNLAAKFFADKIDPSLAAYAWANTSAYVTGVYIEDVLVGYKFFETAEALDPNFKVDDHLAFPFGYGLSYTTFEYSDIKLDKNAFSPTDNNDTITATVTVKNTGSVAGRTAVEMYLSASTWKQEGRPLRDLKNYDVTKVLAPGESQDISFVIEKRDLCWFDDGKRMEDGSSWKPWNLKMSGTEVNATVIPSSDPVFAAYANTQYTSFYNNTGAKVDYSIASNVNANATRGVSAELNDLGYGARASLNGVEAYTTYNGFYGEDGHKTGWRVDRGTTFTVQIGDSSRTPDLEARGVSAKFTYGEYGLIDAPEIWDTDEGTELTYDISVGQTFDTNLITINAKFDADKLVYASSAAAEGFTVISDSFNAETGVYTAKLALLKAGALFSASDPKKILSVNFSSTDNVKDGELVEGVLVSLDISNPQNGTLNLNSNANVFTLISNWLRWDIKADGKISDDDLSFIIYNYYLVKDGDAAWADAKLFDADKNGIINIVDIMIILSFSK